MPHIPARQRKAQPMRFEVHHHHHHDRECDPIITKLDAILALGERLSHAVQTLESTMSAALDKITAEVAESKTATQSAIALINGLAHP